MPNIPIPQYEERTRAPGQLSLARSFVPDQSGAQALAGALTHIGDNVQKIAERDGAIEAAGALSTLRMDAQRMASEAKQRAPEDGADFTPTLMAAWKEHTTDALGKLKSPYAKPFVKERLQEISEQLFSHALNFEVQTRNAYRLNAVKQSAEQLSTAVELDPESWKSAGQEQMLAIEAMQLPPEERTRARELITDTVTGAAARGIARRDPGEALQRLANPNDPVFSSLSPVHRAQANAVAVKGVTDREVNRIMSAYDQNVMSGSAVLGAFRASKVDPKLKEDVESGVRERLGLLRDQRRGQYIQQIAALNADIADGNPPDDAEARAYALYQRGAYTEEGYATLAGSIERARAEHGKSKVDLQLGLAAITNGIPLDPTQDQSKKSIDAAFKQLTGGLQLGSLEWQNAATEVARRTNIAPSDSVSWARIAITSGDPSGSASAAQFLNRLQEANPRAYGYVSDDRLKSFAEQVNTSIAAGADPKAAVSLATRNTYELKKDERELLQKQYELGGGTSLAGKRVEMLDANRSDLQSRLGSDQRFDTSVLSLFGAPPAPPQMTAEYDDAVKRFYMNTGGNLDVARTLAWKDITARWARSEVNGTPEMMKYAPEAMYPQLPTAIIREDIKKTLEGEPTTKALDASKVRLVQSPDTATTAGLQWYLATPGQYGDLEVLNDEKGRPRRYQLPVDAQTIEASATRLKAAAIEKAKRFSESARAERRMLEEAASRGDEGAALRLMSMSEIAPGVD